MLNPCETCDKSDKRPELLKCDKPCAKAKDCVECERLLIQVLQGKIKL